MVFQEVFEKYSWREIGEGIASKTSCDVEAALQKVSPRAVASPGTLTLDDFLSLLSPVAAEYLEPMAQLSRAVTLRRFGKTIQLYIPLYLSNECQNICTYCGFSFDNQIARKTLSEKEILQEVEVIKEYGYDHVLLVTGEANKAVGMEYFRKVLKLIRPYFSLVSMEVQPLAQKEYEELIELGLNTVLVYQETYNPESYKSYHPKGKKSNFAYRLDTPERLGRAGVHKIGLGALIGLADWRIDSWFVALHLSYLRNRYWKSKYSISFPRLRPAEGYQDPVSVMTDRDLVQLICAFRLFDENVELSLSTRETPVFRDHAVHLGVTTMSAGSRTEPGGYSHRAEALEQFATSDERTPHEIASMIAQSGYEPLWKDWDIAVGQSGKAADVIS